MPLISVDDHLAACLALASPLAVERARLSQADGRILAEPVVAGVALPGFDNSAMDGYAVLAADVAGAGPEQPVRLRVVDDLPAGRAATRAVVAGEAIRIMTGAPLPPGADTIVQVEHTDAGTDHVTVFQPAPIARHIRRTGEDVAVGDVVLAAGTRLGPRQIAQVAAVGLAEVVVARRPRVLVLATGSELVEPGSLLAPGQIYESNGHQLAAAVRAAGGVALFPGIVPDDDAALRATLAEHLPDVDLVLTSGGVSAGAYDTVKEVLRATGTVDFVRVAMQPGMPQGCGRLADATTPGRQVPIITLPGNPVSTYVSFEVFVRPVLAVLTGRSTARPAVPATATAGWRVPAAKRQYARVRLTWSPRGAEVAPVAAQRSHLIAELAGANALAVVGEDVTEVVAGDEVTCWLLSDGDLA